MKWRINLEGYPGAETGDVITSDGEIVGSWVLDPEDHLMFFPNGANDWIFMVPGAPMFCERVEACLDARETALDE